MYSRISFLLRKNKNKTQNINGTLKGYEKAVNAVIKGAGEKNGHKKNGFVQVPLVTKPLQGCNER
jgi:small nuclear ribonucleoprotein (snRNP)-like protein